MAKSRKNAVKKMPSKFDSKEKKSTFVAFHFYFLLDLFQTALSFDRRSFFILGLLQTPTSRFHRIHLRLKNALFRAAEFQ